MTWRTRRYIAVVIALLAVSVIALHFYLRLTSNGPITATVTKINYRSAGGAHNELRVTPVPSGYEVRTEDNKQYGLMLPYNDPLAGAGPPQTCVDLSPLEVGDTIEFRLPMSTLSYNLSGRNDPPIFEMCFDAEHAKDDYYIRKL